MNEGQDAEEAVSDDEIRRGFEATADLIRELAVAAEERHDRAEERRDRTEERHDREMDQIRTQLRHAVRLSVEEARRERVRRREADERLDGYITKLAVVQLETGQRIAELAAAQAELSSAQEKTENRLRSLIDALRPGGNGA